MKVHYKTGRKNMRYDSAMSNYNRYCNALLGEKVYAEIQEEARRKVAANED
jgi:hypothetical protein